MEKLRVKVCGITREKDALLACELGADAVGFIFYQKSPRCVTPEKASKIAKELPEHVARVGVFVTPAKNEAEKIASTIGLDVLQIHGNFSPEGLTHFSDLPIVGAFNIDPQFDFSRFEKYQRVLSAFLLDGYKKGAYGGTGKTLDWRKASKAGVHGKVILAGGLSPQNIRTAVKQATPYAVDVNSGVESAPGIKDHEKLKQLFEQIEAFRSDGSHAKPDEKFPLA